MVNCPNCCGVTHKGHQFHNKKAWLGRGVGKDREGSLKGNKGVKKEHPDGRAKTTTIFPLLMSSVFSVISSCSHQWNMVQRSPDCKADGPPWSGYHLDRCVIFNSLPKEQCEDRWQCPWWLQGWSRCRLTFSFLPLSVVSSLKRHLSQGICPDFLGNRDLTHPNSSSWHFQPLDHKRHYKHGYISEVRRSFLNETPASTIISEI